MTIEFSIERRKLQHLFKHAVDFGITGDWNNETAEAFAEAIRHHINNPQVEIIVGRLTVRPFLRRFRRNGTKPCIEV